MTARVFVLGSGFSASMGLPTLVGLFREVMAFPERGGEEDKKQILAALEILYPHFHRDSSPPAYPPFEEFLSLVSAAEDFPFFDDGYWDWKRRSALRLLTDCLAHKSEGAAASDLLREFVGRLENGDVVITFNWDNLIEQALMAQHKTISLLSRDKDAVAVLKLHGSLNWFRIPDNVRLREPNSVAVVQDSVVRTHDYSYYDPWDALNEPPLIIPPIASKRALADEFFKNIWHEALNAIADGQTLAFIGYSIPPDDLQARGLLTLAWTARQQKRRADRSGTDSLLVVDPNPEIGGRYLSLVGGPVEFHQGYFCLKHLPILFSEKHRAVG